MMTESKRAEAANKEFRQWLRDNKDANGREVLSQLMTLASKYGLEHLFMNTVTQSKNATQ